MRSLIVLTSIVALVMSAGVVLADDTDVQYDTSSDSKTGSTAAHTLSWSTHTVANESNRFMTVGISLNHDTTTDDPITVGSVTWIVGATKQGFGVKQAESSTTGTDAVRAEIWSLLAPTTGSGTVKVTLNNISVNDEIIDTSTTGNTAVSAGTIHTGPDGSTTTFSDTDAAGSALSTPVVPSSVTISATVSSSTVTATDDGSGNLTGTGVSSGSVNYSTGAWSITYTTAPDNSTNITASYNHGKYSFSGTLDDSEVETQSVTITAQVNSSAVSITDDGSGSLSGTNVTGTITYSSGAWTLEFTQRAPDNVDITADYQWQNVADVIAGAVSFYNVNQTNPSTNGSAGDDTDTTPTVSVTTDDRDAVFGVVATTGPANSLTKAYNHMTDRWNDNNGTGSTDTRAAGCTAPGADPSTIIRWTLGVARKSAIAAINIKPNNTPTEARFAKARAFATEAGTLVTWRTAYEVHNLGFRVWREDQHGERVRLNRSLIAGSALFARPSTVLSVGRSYVFWDAEAVGTSDRYWLEAVDLDGSIELHGPFLSQPVSGEKPVRDLGNMSSLKARRLSSPPVTQLGRDASKTKLSVKALGAGARSGVGRAGDAFGQWRMAAAPVAKILVDHDGWYRVTRAQLASAGYDPGPSATALVLVNQGHEEPLRITGLNDGRLDMEDAIEFYGRAVDTPFTGVNVYWLGEGLLPGRRLSEAPGDSGLAEPVATFAATVTLQDRSLYVAAVTNNGERDNFYGPVVGFDPLSQVLNVDALPPEGAQQPAILEIALQGVTAADHLIVISFNDHQLDEMEFSGNESAVQTFQIDPSWLRLGANEVILEAQNGDQDVSVTDFGSLTWQRPFVAHGNRLEMTAPPGATVRVSGFSVGDIRLFDLSHRHQHVAILGAIGQTGDQSWAIEAVLPGVVGDGDRLLLAVIDSEIEAPAGLESNSPSSWNTADNGAAMVIIAHSDLLSSAQRLAAYRSAHGVSTVVVDVADLYDEFSWGIKDSEALRVFLKRASAVWESVPGYVLLMGDASVDPRNYLGFGDRDLVPTKILATNLLKTANDDWFADLDGDGLANLAVGRLPAGTPHEAEAMVNKIIGYEQEAPGAWVKDLTLVVDAVTGDFDFGVAVDALEALIPSTLEADRIDFGEMEQDTARQLILDAFEAGRLLVNYDGHGSQAVWVSDDVFGNADALSLGNGFKLPLVVAMNCLNGLFHDVYQDSLAEALLKNPDGGAVMVWASSALTDPTGQDLMNRDLYRSLFGGASPTVGDAVIAAKANVTDQDTRDTWILFGDPSMHLR
ncbi:MAG: hypothetical protein K8R59_12380 [Thermoanaerobaculales bacterium]|nr:hypothetical protein [Thermoanaerobaculales bacterium]